MAPFTGSVFVPDAVTHALLDRRRPQSEPDTLQTLRVRVLQVSLTLLAIAMPVTGLTLIASSFVVGTLLRRTVVLAGATLLFPLLKVTSHRLGFRSSALCLLTCLALSAFLVASRGGLTVGYAAICLLTIQLATLFFGRRGATYAVATVVGLHLLAWFLVQSDLVPPLPIAMWDPRSNALWFRHLVLLGLLGLLLALGELYVVEQLAHSLVVHRELAERERGQRLALERAELEQAREREQRALAQQALERSHRIEALARVAGGVAHDFNNALTVILGTAEAAKFDSRSPEDVETYMDEIADAVQHATILTNQLLTLGRQQLATPKPVSITALLGRLRAAIARVLPSDIALTIDMPNDDATVSVDQSGLDRSVLNLVLNARDAMPRGGTITIGCRRIVVAGNNARLADGAYVVMQIKDTGIGMDQATLARMFEPFFTTKGDKGTGLGLASVYAFIKESGGVIDVESEEGHGTTFSIWLPVTTERASPVSTPPTATPVAARRSGDRILVVEDRDDVRATMVRALQLHGFHVHGVASGDDALIALDEQRRFALMCIDGVMPGLSTAATIERARALAPRMRVIVCSGHVQEDLLRRGIETGRYEFLAKPFSPQELVDRVSRALEQTSR